MSSSTASSLVRHLNVLPLALHTPEALAIPTILILNLAQIALPHRPPPRRRHPLPLHPHLNQLLHPLLLSPPDRLSQAFPPLQVRAEFVLAQLDGLPGVLGQGARRGVGAVLFAAVVRHELFGDGVDDAVGAAEGVDPDADLFEAVGFGAVVGGPVDAFDGYWAGMSVWSVVDERGGGRGDVLMWLSF